MTDPVIQLKDVSFRYDREYVLEHINLTIEKGTFMGLVGPNGSGKSTLLKLILHLLKTKEGSIELFNQDVSKFKDWSRLGFVSQKANSFNSGFPASVTEVVKSGLTKKEGLFKRVNAKGNQQVREALKAVDMMDFANKNIGELSGGQQQRVFIARAIVSQPDVLILDEPTVGVDSQNVKSFYDMLEQLNKEMGITLVLVTHDIGTISNKVSHVVCLNRELHFHGSADDFQKEKNADLSSYYGHDVKRLSHDHAHHHGEMEESR